MSFFNRLAFWRKPEPVDVKPIIEDMADILYADRRYTPDLPELERKPWHWFFSCDETQEGHHNHILLKGCEKSEYSVFTQGRMMMLRQELGMFSTPLSFTDQLGYKNPPPMLPIKGELYKVTPRQFLELDKYRNNTVFCSRVFVPIVAPYTELMFKDRSVAEKVVGKIGKKGGNSVQSGIITKRGVYRTWAFMYISSPSYWGDYLDLNSDHPPVQTWSNPDGLIKDYYRFTNIEYNGGTK